MRSAPCLHWLGSENALIAQKQAEVSFTHDVVPILTKAGCNGGACHAKAGNGQNGFQLSLFEFEPGEDSKHIVNEARGRRISQTSPERSLLLRKAAGTLSHGGGVRLPESSDAYRTVRDWIRQGARSDVGSAPALISLTVDPERTLMGRRQQRQLRVTAAYADGGTRDVTEQAVYESNDRAMAEIDEHGLATTFDIAGNVAMMARYQTKIAVLSVSIANADTLDEMPPSRNFVDEFVFANLKKLGIRPSPICDDAAFLRRVSLDIAGRLPTNEEAEAFLSDRRPDKRDLLIDALLRSPG